MEEHYYEEYELIVIGRVHFNGLLAYCCFNLVLGFQQTLTKTIARNCSMFVNITLKGSFDAAKTNIII